MPLPSDAVRLGDLVVVPSLNRVLRDGAAVDVEPRVMGVFEALAETPGEVVTRERLFATVWADVVVNDEALTRAVSELRKALGPEGRRAVETIRGTGYRLAAPLRPAGLDAPGSVGAPPTEAPSVEAPAPDAPSRPPAVEAPRRSPVAVAALVVASLALALAVWAAWPTPDPAPEASPRVGAPGRLGLEAPSDSGARRQVQDRLRRLQADSTRGLDARPRLGLRPGSVGGLEAAR